MQKTNGPIFEFACHETNIGVSGILGGARADESERLKQPARRRDRGRDTSMTRRTAFIAAIAAIALLAAGSAARAHHAFAAEFDVNKPIKFEGKLIKWDMVNPHSWFYMEIKGEKWMIEGGSPNPADSPGGHQQDRADRDDADRRGYLAKDGTNKAVGRNFILADGSPVPRRLGAGQRSPASAG